MFPATDSALLFIFASVQIVGLLTLAGARMSNTSSWHRYYCGAFLCSLVAVGAATMFAVSCHNGWWLSCGTTLSLMSVGGTIDFGRSAAAL